MKWTFPGVRARMLTSAQTVAALDPRHVAGVRACVCTCVPLPLVHGGDDTTLWGETERGWMKQLGEQKHV